MKNNPAELRKLPQVDRIIAQLPPEAPHPIAAQAARAALDEARASISSGSKAPDESAIVERARLIIRAIHRKRLTRIINATGVLLHTNLGRAPLSGDAVDAVRTLGTGYTNLEYDLEKGGRGSRYAHAAQILQTLTGAEAALVVNNNAAAVLLTLAALAHGREVVISRGELIEIGGGFRIPEILAESGAMLREVGTTNRTHLADYERAIGANTAAIMKVHPSNYRVTGFASTVAASDLVRLAHERGLIMIHDLGSGLLRRRIGEFEPAWLSHEPTVQEALVDGADIVTFSADKLLGGPQGGIILGRADLIARMHSSPLLRAVRVDKSTLAQLQVTLIAYLEGRESELPFWTMALADVADLEPRAETLRRGLEPSDAKVQTIDGSSTTGGGSVPGGEIPTLLVEISPRAISCDELIRSLIEADPPIVARIEDDRVVIDLRTVDPVDDERLLATLRSVLE